MQIWVHTLTVLGVGTSAPRAPLDQTLIASLTSQYWRVSVVELTASTQSDLAELASAGRVTNGDVIAAEFQSLGRGRLDRSFEAPQGTALLFSLFLTPQRDRSEWGFISHLAALAMHEIISAYLSYEIKIKWPNDILIRDKKVAGLIAQIAGEGIVIGIGLNVEMSSEELPVSTATSLAIADSDQLDRNQILAHFLDLFASKFQEWDNGRDFTVEYAEVSATLGRQVQIEVAGRDKRSGLAQSITSTGALMLSDGFEVNVGDVVHLR
jgi:BirA family transcriptional regulator, biotin operon repressor / biotin---[acetyl-CoA-carboxylase] ligase